MEPIDILENVLATQGPSGVRGPLHALATGSLAGLADFAALRWFWWTQHGTDLLRVLPGTSGPWERLGTPDHGLLESFAEARGEVYEVPGIDGGWQPGDPFMLFQERFKTALVQGGAPSRFAFMVLGALNEMASNAAEHANAPVASVASFEVGRGRWCFSVTDVGCGLLRSLRRNPTYAGLPNEASAVRFAVRDGVSSTGNPSRGNGFTQVFKSLADRRCSIRFRSAAAMATWSGSSPVADQLTITVSPPRVGFHVQVEGGL